MEIYYLEDQGVSGRMILRNMTSVIVIKACQPQNIEVVTTAF
jgi:hypothetical protein